MEEWVELEGVEARLGTTQYHMSVDIHSTVMDMIRT